MYKLSPSKAHRYLQCTMSLRYDTEFVETAASIRGTELHELAKEILNIDGAFLDQKLFDKYNVNDFEEFLITSYKNYIINEYKRFHAFGLHIEEKDSMNLYGNNINYIIDAWFENDNEVVVVDLKTGRVVVGVEDNEQLLLYAFALLNKTKAENFKLVIFQNARAYETTITRTEILDFVFNKYETFDKINNDTLEYNPSEKACRYCEHKKKCLAYAQWVLGGKDG